MFLFSLNIALINSRTPPISCLLSSFLHTYSTRVLESSLHDGKEIRLNFSFIYLHMSYVLLQYLISVNSSLPASRNYRTYSNRRACPYIFQLPNFRKIEFSNLYNSPSGDRKRLGVKSKLALNNPKNALKYLPRLFELGNA